MPKEGQTGEVRWDYRMLQSGKETRVGLDLASGKVVTHQEKTGYRGKPIVRRGNRYFTDKQLWDHHVTVENSGHNDPSLPPLPSTQAVSDQLREGVENSRRQESSRRLFSMPDLPWKKGGR